MKNLSLLLVTLITACAHPPKPAPPAVAMTAPVTSASEIADAAAPEPTAAKAPDPPPPPPPPPEPKAARPAGCDDALAVLDAGHGEENSITVATPDADHAVAQTERKTATRLAAVKAADPHVHDLIGSIVSKTRAAAAAVDIMATEMKKPGKVASIDTQRRVRESAIARRREEDALRSACDP